MAFKYFDRVKETSVTTGTGAITLAGSVAGFITFSSVYANADTLYYTITDQAGSNWEVGIGTYNSGPNTLTRTLVKASSNGGAAVNFASGALYVFTTIAAAQLLSAGNSTTGTGNLVLATAPTVAGLTSTAPVTATAFIPTSANLPANGINLPAANTIGVIANSVPVATFNTPGSGGDYHTFSNVNASGLSSITNPTSCVAALAGLGAGNLTNGNYIYKITYLSTLGETGLGTVSNTINVVDHTTNGQMALTSIPLSVSGSVTARNIYRTVAGGSTYYFLHQIADNTTTIYTDNIADATILLGYSAPTGQSQIPTYVTTVPATTGGDTSIGRNYKTLGTTTTGSQFNGLSNAGILTTGTHDFYCANALAMRITDTYWNPLHLYGGPPDGGIVISSGSSQGSAETSAIVSAEIFNSATATSSTLRLNAKGRTGEVHFVTNGYIGCSVAANVNPNGNNQYCDAYGIDLSGVAQGSGLTASISLQSSNGVFATPQNLVFYHAGTGDFIFASDNTNTAMFRVFRAANAVNQIYILPAATGGTALVGSGLSSQGVSGDANAPIGITASGTGSVVLYNGGGANALLTAANSGDITANAGNYVLATANKSVVLKRGANGKTGSFTLTGTTAVTVTNTSISTSDCIIFSLNTVGGTVGSYPTIKTITAATGFTVAGAVGDISTYNYGVISSAV